MVATLIDESLALERTGEVAAALQRAQQALEEARRLSEPNLVARALARLAEVRFRLGQYGAARVLAQEILTLVAPDAPARADALLRLASCAAETHSLAEAEAFYQQAADLARELGYRLAHLLALHGLAASVYIPRGQFDLALAADQEAYRIACECGLQEWAYFPLLTTAWVYIVTTQPYRACRVLDDLRPLVTPGSWVQGYYFWLSGDLALDEGNVEGARRLYSQARSIAEAVGEPRLNIALRAGMSRLHRAQGEGPPARAWAEDAVQFAARVGYQHAHGIALVERARAAWLCGDMTAAEGDLQAASEILVPLGAAFDLARAWLLLAALRFACRAPLAELHVAWLEAVSRLVSGGYVFLLEQERSLAFPLLASLQNSADPHVTKVTRVLLGHLKRVPPPPLRIVTLGRYVVCRGGRSIEQRAFRQRRAADLLALLLLAPGRTLSFDEAVEALCPERDSGAAQVFFHHATSSLRRALEPDLPGKFPSRYLEVEEGQVSLRLPPGSWVDFEAFEAHCRVGEWEEALALYGGSLLPDYRYADWVVAARERLNLLYQRALLTAAQSRLASGGFVEALDACLQCLALEPWQELAVQIGMRACLGLNDRAGALRLYRDLERALREELNTAPSAELRSLYDSLIG